MDEPVTDGRPTRGVARALVTGAGRGIGLAIAQRLAQDGVEVALHANASQAQAEQAAEIIRSTGRDAAVFVADLSTPSGVNRLADEVGPVDILVNNAARSQEKPFEEIAPIDIDEMLAVNLKAPFRLTQLALPYMVDRGWGRIVNIASIGGQWGGINQIHYATSKAGLIGLTRSIAKTYGRHGITANAIAPGLIETDMSAGELRRPDGREKLRGIPLGRVGQPAEVAAAVSFLVSEEAGYLTGQTINLNGGMLFS